MVTVAPAVGTNASSPGLAASISLNPRSYCRAISMRDSSGRTARKQTAPMTSTLLQSPDGPQSAVWMAWQVGAGATGAATGSLLSATGGHVGAAPADRETRTSQAPGT